MKTLHYVLAVAAVFTATPLALATPADAAPFFRCQSGYTYDENNAGTGAHCKKQIDPTVRSINCPSVTLLGRRIGTAPRVKSGRDMCRGTINVGGVSNSTEVAPLACNSGYTLQRNYQGNADKCVKPGGWVYKAPTVHFNSN